MRAQTPCPLSHISGRSVNPIPERVALYVIQPPTHGTNFANMFITHCHSKFRTKGHLELDGDVPTQEQTTPSCITSSVPGLLLRDSGLSALL
jgi:hypothetical protein